MTSSVFVFFPVDHYGSSQLVARLHLLDGRSARPQKNDLRWVFDRPVAEFLPIRGHIDSYSEFVASHRHFFVYGPWSTTGWDFRRENGSEENNWLVDQLLRDGAQVLTIWHDVGGIYNNFQLFEVTLTPAPTATVLNQNPR